MRKKAIIAALLAVGVTSFQASATEGGGKITFNGEINSGACSIAPDSVDQTVEMGSISASLITNNGTSNPVPFSINLKDCDGTKNKVKITFTGTGDSNDSTLLALMSGRAAGAGIMLMDSNQNQIKLGDPSNDISISEGDSVLRLQAALKKTTGTVTPGNFQSFAQFRLAYN